MQVETILILIAVSMLFLYVVFEGINALRKRSYFNPIPLFLMLLGILFIIVVHYGAKELVTRDWAEILLTIGLLTITAVYVQSTAKMAKEMKEQRLSEAQPYLLLRLDLEEGVFLQWDTYKGEKPPDEFEVTIRNAGKGPAINLEASLWDPKSNYFGTSKGYLAPGEEWQFNMSKNSTSGVELGIEEVWLPELRKEIKQEYAGVVTVKYSDIHHRAWVSYLCLERHVDIEAFVSEAEQNIVELKT